MIKKFNEYVKEDLKITGEYDGRAEELNYTEEDLIDAAKNCNNAKAFVRHITYGSTNETDTLSKEDNKKLTDWFNNHKSANESASQSNNEETFPSSANRIYNVLSGGTFEEWYNKDFMDYIEGDDKAKSKGDILADIKDMFK